MYSRFESIFYFCQGIFDWLMCKQQPTYTKSVMDLRDDFPYKMYQSDMI